MGYGGFVSVSLPPPGPRGGPILPKPLELTELDLKDFSQPLRYPTGTPYCTEFLKGALPPQLAPHTFSGRLARNPSYALAARRLGQNAATFTVDLPWYIWLSIVASSLGILGVAAYLLWPKSEKQTLRI